MSLLRLKRHWAPVAHGGLFIKSSALAQLPQLAVKNRLGEAHRRFSVKVFTTLVVPHGRSGTS